jgi:hypothetical protein
MLAGPTSLININNNVKKIATLAPPPVSLVHFSAFLLCKIACFQAGGSFVPGKRKDSSERVGGRAWVLQHSREFPVPENAIYANPKKNLRHFISRDETYIWWEHLQKKRHDIARLCGTCRNK